MSVPIQWRTKKQRYNLQGSRCPECSNVVFPPRGVCPYCSREHESVDASIAQISLNSSQAQPVVFTMPAAPVPLAVAVGGDD